MMNLLSPRRLPPSMLIIDDCKHRFFLIAPFDEKTPKMSKQE